MSKDKDGTYRINGREVSEEMISLVLDSSNFANFRHDIANAVFCFDSESQKDMGLDANVLVDEDTVVKEWGGVVYNHYIEQVNTNYQKGNHRFIIDFKRDGKCDSVLKFYVLIILDSEGVISAVEGLYAKESYGIHQTSNYAYDGVNIRNIINNLNVLLFLVDQNLDVVEYNLYGEKVFGEVASNFNKRIPLTRFLGIEEPDLKDIVGNRKQLEGDTVSLDDINNNRYDYSFNTSQISSSTGTSYILFSGIDITEKKKQKEQLLYNEMKFRTLFEQSPYGINIYDTNKKLLNSNAAFLTIIGVNKNENIIGLNLFDCLDLSEIEYKKLETDGVVNIVKEFDFSDVKRCTGLISKINELKYLEITITKIKSSGKNLDFGYVEMVVDKTEEYKTYLNLKRKTEQLSLATTAGNVGVYEINLVDWTYAISPEGAAMFEDDLFTNSSPLEQFFDIMHPDDYVGLLKNTSALKRGDSESFSMEYRVKKSDGRWKWIQTSCRINEYMPEEGIISVIGVNIDIDKIKRAEQKAYKREELLRQTLTIGKIGFWEYDINKNIVSLGKDLISSLNLGYSTFNGMDFTFQQFITVISTEDRKIVEREYIKIANGLADSTSFDVRLSDKYDFTWISIIAHVNRRDESGVPISLSGFILNIHEKAYALEELKKTKYFLDSALSISRVGYIYEHYEDKIIDISDSCCEIFDLSKHEIKIPGVIAKNIHEDDLEEYQSFLERAVVCCYEETKSVIYRMMIKGELRLIHEFANIHFDSDKRMGTLYTIQDITELHEKETQLQELLDNQRILSEISIMIMATLDVVEMIDRLLDSIKFQFGASCIVFYERRDNSFVSKRHISNCKYRSSTITESDFEWVINRFSSESPLFVDSGHDEFNKFVEIFSAKGKNLFFIPVFIHNELSGVLYMRISSVDKCILSYSNGFTHNLINLINIAFEKYYNEIVLIEAKNRAEESDSLKTAFLKNMSHEIRTPLNSIVGFSNLISEISSTDSEVMEYANVVNRNTEQLLDIINNVIEFSEIESSSIVVNMASSSINDVCHNVFKRYFSRSSDVVKITYNIPDKDVFVYTDVLRLEQVLQGLVDNSIKYTNEGIINFGYKIEKDKLVFFVSDTGRGIAEEEREKVFERFYQSDYMSSGTGLGLSIVKAILEKLSGEIWFESELNVGTTFYFSIPIVE